MYEQCLCTVCAIFTALRLMAICRISPPPSSLVMPLRPSLRQWERWLRKTSWFSTTIDARKVFGWVQVSSFADVDRAEVASFTEILHKALAASFDCARHRWNDGPVSITSCKKKPNSPRVVAAWRKNNLFELNVPLCFRRESSWGCVWSRRRRPKRSEGCRSHAPPRRP